MTEKTEETPEQTLQAVLALPRRRGVVMRGDEGVHSDSYGTEYVRDEGTGQLFRVGPKMNRGRVRAKRDAANGEPTS